MAGRKLWSALAALVILAGGLAVGTASSAPARGDRGVDRASSSAGPSCTRCRRIVRKANRCKRQNDDSASCKRAIRKSRRCKRILRSARCKRSGGGAQPPAGASCPAYSPGEQGAGKPTAVVTDAATAEQPIEVKLEFSEGVPESPANEIQYYNVQVDAAAAEAGLFVRLEFQDPEDMDLYMYHPTGDEAAHAAGYNPAPVGPNDGTGSGGHSETGAEQLDGIRTKDCQGYTVEMRPFQNAAGEKTLKLWLGAIENDPA